MAASPILANGDMTEGKTVSLRAGVKAFVPQMAVTEASQNKIYNFTSAPVISSAITVYDKGHEATDMTHVVVTSEDVPDKVLSEDGDALIPNENTTGLSVQSKELDTYEGKTINATTAKDVDPGGRATPKGVQSFGLSKRSSSAGAVLCAPGSFTGSSQKNLDAATCPAAASRDGINDDNKSSAPVGDNERRLLDVPFAAFISARTFQPTFLIKDSLRIKGAGISPLATLSKDQKHEGLSNLEQIAFEKDLAEMGAKCARESKVLLIEAPALPSKTEENEVADEDSNIVGEKDDKSRMIVASRCASGASMPSEEKSSLSLCAGAATFTPKGSIAGNTTLSVTDSRCDRNDASTQEVASEMEEMTPEQAPAKVSGESLVAVNSLPQDEKAVILVRTRRVSPSPERPKKIVTPTVEESVALPQDKNVIVSEKGQEIVVLKDKTSDATHNENVNAADLATSKGMQPRGSTKCALNVSAACYAPKGPAKTSHKDVDTNIPANSIDHSTGEALRDEKHTADGSEHALVKTTGKDLISFRFVDKDANKLLAVSVRDKFYPHELEGTIETPEQFKALRTEYSQVMQKCGIEKAYFGIDKNRGSFKIAFSCEGHYVKFLRYTGLKPRVSEQKSLNLPVILKARSHAEALEAAQQQFGMGGMIYPTLIAVEEREVDDLLNMQDLCTTVAKRVVMRERDLLLVELVVSDQVYQVYGVLVIFRCFEALNAFTPAFESAKLQWEHRCKALGVKPTRLGDALEHAARILGVDFVHEIVWDRAGDPKGVRKMEQLYLRTAQSPSALTYVIKVIMTEDLVFGVLVAFRNQGDLMIFKDRLVFNERFPQKRSIDNRNVNRHPRSMTMNTNDMGMRNNVDTPIHSMQNRSSINVQSGQNSHSMDMSGGSGNDMYHVNHMQNANHMQNVNYMHNPNSMSMNNMAYTGNMDIGRNDMYHPNRSSMNYEHSGYNATRHYGEPRYDNY